MNNEEEYLITGEQKIRMVLVLERSKWTSVPEPSNVHYESHVTADVTSGKAGTTTRFATTKRTLQHESLRQTKATRPALSQYGLEVLDAKESSITAAFLHGSPCLDATVSASDLCSREEDINRRLGSGQESQSN